MSDGCDVQEVFGRVVVEETERGASPEKLAPGGSFLIPAPRGARPYLVSGSFTPGDSDSPGACASSAGLATLLAALAPRANVKV